MSEPKLEVRLADPEGFVELFQDILLYFRNRKEYVNSRKRSQNSRSRFESEEMKQQDRDFIRNIKQLVLFLNLKDDLTVCFSIYSYEFSQPIGSVEYDKKKKRLNLWSEMLWHCRDEIKEIGEHIGCPIFFKGKEDE